MKKIIIITFAVLLVAPSVAMAAWWNPLTWFNNWGRGEVKKEVVVPEVGQVGGNMLFDVINSTSTVNILPVATVGIQYEKTLMPRSSTGKAETFSVDNLPPGLKIDSKDFPINGSILHGLVLYGKPAEAGTYSFIVKDGTIAKSFSLVVNPAPVLPKVLSVKVVEITNDKYPGISIGWHFLIDLTEKLPVSSKIYIECSDYKKREQPLIGSNSVVTFSTTTNGFRYQSMDYQTTSYPKQYTLPKGNCTAEILDRNTATSSQPVVSCPQLMPPAPGFCRGGNIIPGKIVNGCEQPPMCDIPQIIIPKI